MGTLLALFGLLILVAVLYWAINKLAPAPMNSYLVVILVVLATFYAVGMLTGYAPMPQTLLHR